MALFISSNKLNSDDNGVYSWADALITYGTRVTPRDAAYFTASGINLNQGTLNITNETLYLKGSVFANPATGGVLNFGEKKTDQNGDDYGVNGCTLIIDNDSLEYFGYTQDQEGITAQGSSVNLYGCNIIVVGNATKTNICISEALNCTFTELDPTSKDVAVTVQASGTIKNCVFNNLSHLSVVTFDTLVSGLIFNACDKNIEYKAAGTTISVSQIETADSVTQDFNVQADTQASIRFINSQLDLTKTIPSNALNTRFKAVTVNVQLQDSSGVVQGAKFLLDSLNPGNGTNTSFSALSDDNGIVAEIIADIESSSGLNPNSTQNHSEYFLQIQSYSHSPYVVKLFLSDPIGPDAKAPQILALREDAIITQTKTLAESLTSIDNPEQAYNRWKAESINSVAGLPIISRVSDLLNTLGVPVILDPDAPEVFSFDGTSFVFKTSLFTGNVTGQTTLKNGAKIVDGTTTGNIRHDVSGQLLHLPHLEVG